MSGLVAFLARSWDVVEAEFAARYGLDLAGACWGPRRVGVRRLRTLVLGLPNVAEQTPAPVAAAPSGSGWRGVARRMMGGGGG